MSQLEPGDITESGELFGADIAPVDHYFLDFHPLAQVLSRIIVGNKQLIAMPEQAGIAATPQFRQQSTASF